MTDDLVQTPTIAAKRISKTQISGTLLPMYADLYGWVNRKQMHSIGNRILSQWRDSLRRRRGLLDDADEREAGAAVDVVLLVRQDERLGRHHLQVGAPRTDPRRRVHLRGGTQGAFRRGCGRQGGAIGGRRGLKLLLPAT